LRVVDRAGRRLPHRFRAGAGTGAGAGGDGGQHGGGRDGGQPRHAGRAADAQRGRSARRTARRGRRRGRGTGMTRRALVFGATGFLGRHLTATLLGDGVAVLVACRSQASRQKLFEWLAGHGCADLPDSVPVDFDAPGLGIGTTRLDGITEIYNCAGAYRFGMSREQARKANVDSARAIVEMAAALPGLERLVHVSGYRVAERNDAVEWSAEHTRRVYRDLGPYEAS